MTDNIGDQLTRLPNDDEKNTTALKACAVLGQYKNINFLGRGGMGEVYNVEHTTLRLCYALKILPTNFSTRNDALSRFSYEARIMAQLQHHNITKVDDFGETDGKYWLRMELAVGLNDKIITF